MTIELSFHSWLRFCAMINAAYDTVSLLRFCAMINATYETVGLQV